MKNVLGPNTKASREANILPMEPVTDALGLARALSLMINERGRARPSLMVQAFNGHWENKYRRSRRKAYHSWACPIKALSVQDVLEMHNMQRNDVNLCQFHPSFISTVVRACHKHLTKQRRRVLAAWRSPTVCCHLNGHQIRGRHTPARKRV